MSNFFEKLKNKNMTDEEYKIFCMERRELESIVLGIAYYQNIFELTKGLVVIISTPNCYDIKFRKNLMLIKIVNCWTSEWAVIYFYEDLNKINYYFHLNCKLWEDTHKKLKMIAEKIIGGAL